VNAPARGRRSDIAALPGKVSPRPNHQSRRQLDRTPGAAHVGTARQLSWATQRERQRHVITGRDDLIKDDSIKESAIHLSGATERKSRDGASRLSQLASAGRPCGPMSDDAPDCATDHGFPNVDPHTRRPPSAAGWIA